jgi:hypothetical protein
MATVSSLVAVVIILYRSEIEWHERISLLQVTKILGKHKFIAIYPRGSNPIGLGLLPIHTKRYELDPKWFVSREAYNKLLLTPDFYANFLEFKRILLFQLDAFVFEDRLTEFSSLEYDYMGAPWLSGEYIQRYNFPFSIQTSKLFFKLNPQLKCYVGNGGFSLRNPSACQQLLSESSCLERKLSLNEDGFFAYHGLKHKKYFKVAPLEVAVDFAWENDSGICYERNQNRLPFGCHAWQKGEKLFIREFMVPFLEEYISVCPETKAFIDRMM